MTLPSNDTPLYNHALHTLEQWLEQQGCEQDLQVRERWQLEQPEWTAILEFDTTEIQVSYDAKDGRRDVVRVIPYSASRHEFEEALFEGP
jgi:hypothetical protein